MQNTRDKKILVTGAGGFIGSHVTELLLNAGAKVTAFVRYTSTGQAGFLDEINIPEKRRLNIVPGDIRSYEDVKRAVGKNDIIIHLAAQIAIPYSYISPGDFLNVNTVGTINILNAAREKNIKRIVQLSTSEVYGSAQYLPIDENHPQVAQSPYAASKIASDKLAESFHRSYNLPVVIARPFNTYGPRQSARAVIPTIIIQALRGKTISLGNIHTRRDLNFVGDTAAALIKIALSSKSNGEQFNICSGKDYSIEEIVKQVGNLLGNKLIIKTDKRRVRPKKSDIDRLLGDRKRAVETFGLAKIIDISKGLEKTIEYFNARIDKTKKEDYQL
ncbi:MAG: SDR family NAD(P)-dependent oxidoreductase [candidate division Zixibacteria bacterium]